MVKPNPYTPARGDLIWLDFSPQAGREQAGRRPALVLSPFEYNKKTRRAIVCPITSKVKGFPFEVLLPSDCGITGAVLTDHIKNQDIVARNAQFIAKLDDDVLNEVLELVRVLL